MPETPLPPERQLPADRIVPSMETIAPVVDEVLDIAREQLERPLTVKLWTWEDGGFKIRVEHGYPVPTGTRYSHDTAIQYHSRYEVVKAFLLEDDLETGDERVLIEEKLAEIPDPVPRKNRDDSTATRV